MADRDNIIRMARQARMDAMVGTTREGKYEPKVAALKRSVPVEWLERFAEVVKADFLQRTGQYLTNDASREAAIADAVAEEREACALACEAIEDDKWALFKGRPPYTGREPGRASDYTQGESGGAAACADAIHARGAA